MVAEDIALVACTSDIMGSGFVSPNMLLLPGSVLQGILG
jgi:hypothetical protein